MNRKLFILVVFFTTLGGGLAQAQDSLIYSITEFYNQLLVGHPLIKQANLLSEYGRQEVRLARGLFDPKIASSLQAKEFKSIEYYRLWDTEVKIPVWIGTDLKVGYERNRGANLNPERSIPINGLLYAGISVPIGQGLLIDMRRAALREAQYAREIIEADRIKLINKLILQCTKDYWAWYASYKFWQLANKGYNLAKFRFEGIKESVEQGDLAPIDSVEAKIIFQEREAALQQALVELTNARLILSNHLWSADGDAVELISTAKPSYDLNEFGATYELQELLTFAKENHPELIKLDFKLKQLEVMRRFSIEMLKPVINFNYNMLGQSPAFDSDNSGAFFQNNFKYSLDFSFPIFLRKERAKLVQTNIKLDQTRLERSQVNREILNEINAVYNDLQNFTSLLRLQEDIVNNYQTLLTGELEKFNNGESSLFLVNTRETKLLEGEAKLIDLQFKYTKARAELIWAAGRSN